MRQRNPALDYFPSFGKIPPQALDLEEVVLGSMLLEKTAIDKIVSILKPEAFYKEAHQIIFNAIIELDRKNEPADILTVTEHLRETGNLEKSGGPYEITKLTDRVASTCNIEFHARIILQKFLQREIIRISTELINDAYNDESDPLDLVERFGKEYDTLNTTAQSGAEMVHISDAIHETVAELINREKYAKQGNVAGISTPLKEMNRILGGWMKSDLVIIAARPSMGKTAFMLQIAKTAAINKIPVAIFSMEMSRISLTNRLLLSENGINDENYRSGFMTLSDWASLNQSSMMLENLPIYIDDRPGLSMQQIKAKATQMKRAGKCSMVLIDYLQLSSMKSENKNYNREQEVSESSRVAKGMAKILNVPVILLSQLSRETEKRGGDHRPLLSDLRESGSIEQDADIVIFPHRPAYYDKQNEELKGVIDFIIAKHRNGPTGTISARHNENITRIFDTPTELIPANVNFYEKNTNPF